METAVNEGITGDYRPYTPFDCWFSSWRRSDGRPLDESRTILLSGDTILRIRDLEASDAGRYICVVAGSERQYFDVTLETSWPGKPQQLILLIRTRKAMCSNP